MDHKLSGCPHCGRQLKTGDGDGFVLQDDIGKASHCRIACPCGIMTRLCLTMGDLRTIWNTRRNKPWQEPVITVKHPGPRGAEPGTVSSELVQDGPF